MKVMRILAALFTVAMITGCGQEGVATQSEAPRAEVKPIGHPRLAADMRRLQALSTALEGLAEEMVVLQRTVRLKERGHYTSDEHDRIENLLFRYLVCRESLWEVVNYYRDYRDHFESPDDQTRGFLVGFNAALHLAYYSSLVVATFLDEEAVIDKLNETYPRSDIPRGTYDRLFKAVTAVENIEALQTAWTLYREEMSDPRSVLHRVSVEDAAYRELAVEIADMHDGVEARTRLILEKRSLLLPDVRNRLRHSSIAALATKAKHKFGDGLYAARGILFVNISRLKSPTAANVKFSGSDLARMRELMQPGDLIMTFSAGYMSNIFLPGKFKHGITYVGLPADRKALGLGQQALENIPEQKITQLRKDLDIAALPSGQRADLIEAVAEGVIFNSLEAITAEHVARLVVLRPRLSAEERLKSLTTVFLLLGSIYDFKFDFTNGSAQCCTEVIYRALHTCGPVVFTLTRRAGVETLAADDIIRYHLGAEEPVFDFVLLAEEDKTKDGHLAKILTGADGNARLSELMAGDGS